MPDIDTLLRDLAGREATSPRITWYDDTTGPTAGERVELSGKVLVNWVAKAANLLQDEFDAGPGTLVGIVMAPSWRAVYWALGAWAVGAAVVTGGGAGDCDVVVTDEAAVAAGSANAVLVTRAALARSHPDEAAAPGAIVEARELASHPDVFIALNTPGPQDLAWLDRKGDGRVQRTSFAELLAADAKDRKDPKDPKDPKDSPDPKDAKDGRAQRVAIRAGRLAKVLRITLTTLAAGGSVVVFDGAPTSADRTTHAARLAAERVTVDRT